VLPALRPAHIDLRLDDQHKARYSDEFDAANKDGYGF
jgi:hypothetical protein